MTDTDCGSELCARSHECAAPSELRKVQVIWTIAGHVPDTEVCANATSEDFTVRFDTDPEPETRVSVSFGPVACELGRFTVDALPSWYWIGGINSREAGMSVPLDDAGIAKVDIPF